MKKSIKAIIIKFVLTIALCVVVSQTMIAPFVWFVASICFLLILDTTHRRVYKMIYKWFQIRKLTIKLADSIYLHDLSIYEDLNDRLTDLQTQYAMLDDEMSRINHWFQHDYY